VYDRPVLDAPTTGRMGDVHEDQDEILRRMRLARNYNSWLLDRAQPHLGRRVLDAGAGTGTFVDLMLSDRELVVAVEPDPLFADGLRKRFAGRDDVLVVQGSAEGVNPDALSGPIDAVVCFNVLEHIADDRAALASLRDVLRPGGALLLLVPAHPRLYGATDRIVAHERRYTKAALRDVLHEAGFSIADLRYVNPVGALGWLVSSRLLKRELIPERSLRVFDKLVPVLKPFDRLRLPMGLSVWAVARR
jgi:SAM-dependent methyltransferase